MSSQTLEAVPAEVAGLRRWSEVKRERRTARRAEERTGGARFDRAGERINAVLLRLPSVRELTPSQRTLLLWLAEAILVRGGSLVQGQGEIAAELNVSRRTVIRAVARLRALELLDAHATKQLRSGGTDKCRYRLPRWLWLMFVAPGGQSVTGCDTKSPPYPKGTENKPSRLRARRGGGAATPPERIFSALAGRLTARTHFGEVDRRVLLLISRTLPETHYGTALRLAGELTEPDMAWVRAPGAFVRLKLAAELAADGLEVPPSWRVAPREADVVAARERRGPGAAAPAARPRGAPRPVSDVVAAALGKSAPVLENRPPQLAQDARSARPAGSRTPGNITGRAPWDKYLNPSPQEN